LVEEFRDEFGVERSCNALYVSRSGYYSWRKQPVSNRELENSELLKLIKEIHAESRGIFGSPAINSKLKELGHNYNHKRVERVMRENNIRSNAKKKFKVTTDSKHKMPVADNLLKRDFSPEQKNQAWCGDITYIRTDEGWLYLATVIDLYSRKVIGWSLDENMTRQLVIDAFETAYQQREKPEGVIFHSDRGSQYASKDFKTVLSLSKAKQSMSRKGDCWDNACAESFFASLKKEVIYRNHYRTREEARAAIFWYIEVFYNRYRPHSYLNGISPETYENKKQKAVA
jgi:transposase InsO family protein